MTEIREARLALDHLLIGSPTLESGIAWLEERTGVRAAPGGSHPGLGTWNALASLGERQYLEIISPDPDQPGVETFYLPGLRDLAEPGVSSWAAVDNDLVARFTSRVPPGFACDPPRSGSRAERSGKVLTWRLAFPGLLRGGRLGGVLPFFIQWPIPETHPGRFAPPGLTLKAFSLEHPEPETVLQALHSLGLDCPVECAPAASIRVELETPRGTVVL